MWKHCTLPCVSTAMCQPLFKSYCICPMCHFANSGLKKQIVSCLRAEMRQQEGVVSCRDGCCSCACRVRCGLTAVKLSAVLLLATCCSQCPRRMCPVLHPTLHTPGHTVSVHHDTCAFQGCTVGSACQVVLGQGSRWQSARCSMLL